MKSNPELNLLIQEANTLSSTPSWTKADERRFAALQVMIPAVRNGASLAEVQQEQLNEVEIRNGLTPTRLRRKRLNEEQRAKAVFMQSLVKGNCGEVKVQGGHEFRDESEGNLLAGIGTYSGLGSFVPTDCFATVRASMLEHDCLFDGDVVTRIDSTNGHTLRLGNYDDASNEATLVAEGANLAGDMVNLGDPNEAVLAAYSYRTPIHKFSTEVFNDLEASYGAYALFEKFASDRMARGIGKILLTGSGSGQTTGLITALEALDVPAVTAAGSSANDGGAGTGANSLGSADFANLWGSINREYRESPSACWIMNDSTLTFVSAIVTKQGLPLVNFRDGAVTILNKPVCISPSMPSIGSKTIPVIFGDASYWFTRLVSDQMTRIRVLRETYAEHGQVGIQMFMRADGVLNYTGAAANTPINYIQCHS